MNAGAASPGPDPTAWTELLRRGRDQGTLTQEEVLEAVELDPGRLDADLAWVRSELERNGIHLDESLPDAAVPGGRPEGRPGSRSDRVADHARGDTVPHCEICRALRYGSNRRPACVRRHPRRARVTQPSGG